MNMNDKMRKAFIELNKAIDSDIDKTYQKLYDKYLNLELSHNRKKKALLKIQMAIDAIRRDNPKITPIYNVSVDVLEIIDSLCEDALFSDGRVNERIKK